MANLTLRVFLSSPGDVGDERRIAQRVLERLQGRYAAAIAIEPIVWEHEPVRATATFQQQIASPADCDVVICMLWSRLGTRLPPDFRRADGSVYDSGTAFEFETASATWAKNGRPDLLVYRKTAPPIVDVRDRVQRETRAAEWDRLVAYLDEWFRNPDGSFKAGFTAFERPDELEELLEQHLDALIRERLAGRRVDDAQARAPVWLRGSPFRGLEVFDVEHESIFHGRTRAISEVKDRLSRRASEGVAFLLIYGRSGSGKSSLVRAGVLPAIMDPGVVEGIGLWRYCVLRPSHGTSPTAALLEALAKPEALPELRGGDFTAAELAALVAESPDNLVAPVRAALRRSADAEQQREKLSEPPVARIAIVVDQLEELFTAERIDGGARGVFVDALRALARSGCAWVIATIRSDFFHRCSDVPVLAELKDGLGSYELMPPAGREIAQMIRNPAAAAGLRFAEDPEEGRLDDVLQEAAAKNPGSLPLLEFVLDALYAAAGERRELTFDAYRTLGRLEGAIAKRADEIVAALAPNVQAALPAVLRALVTIRGDAGPATARVADAAQLRATPERSALVDALVAARLLVTDGGDSKGGVVRVAHEALLNEWPRAQEIIRESRADLLARERVQEDAGFWSAERARDLLLPPGKRLLEATDLVNRRRAELDPLVVEYVDASRAADRRARTLRTSLVAGTFAVLAVLLGAAVWQWRDAQQQTALAMSRQLATAAEQAYANGYGLGGYQESLVLAVEAYLRAPTAEATEVLKERVQSAPLLERTLWVDSAHGIAAAFSPDDERLAVYSGRDDRSTVETFSLRDGARVAVVDVGEPIHRLAWGGELVATDGLRRSLLVLGETGVRERISLEEECKDIRQLGVAPSGEITVACYDHLRKLVKNPDGTWRQERIDGAGQGEFGAMSVNGSHALRSRGELAVWNEGVVDVGKLGLAVDANAVRAHFDEVGIDATGQRWAVETETGIEVWALDADRGTPLVTLPAGQYSTQIVFSPQGRYLAVVYGDHIDIFAVGAVAPVGRARAALGPLSTAVALSKDRARFAVGSTTGLVTLRDVASGSLEILNGTPGRILAPFFLAEAGDGGAPNVAVLMLDPETVIEPGEAIEPNWFLVNGRPVGVQVRRARDWQPLGAPLELGAFEEVLDPVTLEKLVGRPHTGSVVRGIVAAVRAIRKQFNVETGTLPVVAVSPGGELSAKVDDDKRVHVLSRSSGNRTSPLELAARIDERALAVADNGAVVIGQRATPYVAEHLHVLPAGGGAPVELWEGHPRNNGLGELAISPRGDRVAAEIRGQLLLWERNASEWKERELTESFDAPRGPIAFAPDGERAFVGDRIVTIADGAQLSLIEPLEDLETVTFDDSGRYLAASNGNDVRVWDAATGALLVKKNLFPHGTTALDFEADARVNARDSDRAVTLAPDQPRGVGTREERAKPVSDAGCVVDGFDPARLNLSLRALDRLEGTLMFCTEALDTAGQRLQYGLRGDWLVLWKLPTDGWLERACRQAGRNLSRKEWTLRIGESARYRETCPGYPVPADL